MKKGLLIVFSGPSGVGKGTILKEVMKDESLKLTYSVSMTTRKPRDGEVNGINYFFVSKEGFEKAIDNHELLEYATYVDNYYGTPKNFVEKKREEGMNVVLEIDLQGAKQVMARAHDALSIFIEPPSMEELERRIRGRQSETEETIKKRIEVARNEMASRELYDYVVCNDELTKAIEDVKEIIRKEMEKSDC